MGFFFSVIPLALCDSLMVYRLGDATKITLQYNERLEYKSIYSVIRKSGK